MTTKLLLIIIINLSLLDLNAQSDKLIISGNVKDKTIHQRNLADIWVKLVDTDSLVSLTKTDSIGNFRITISKNLLSNNPALILYQDISTYKKKYIIDSFCVNLKYYDRQYTSLKYELKKDSINSKDSINLQILMFKQTWDFNYPFFKFKKNTTILTNNDFYEGTDSSWSNPETALKYMNCFLNVNKGYKIVLRGKAGIDEFHSDSLATKRAILIKEKLIKMGSDSRQIIILPNSNKLSTRDKIPANKPKSEKEKLLSRYYICGLSIIEPEFETNGDKETDDKIED